MIHHELPCAAAREQLSARLDGAANDQLALATHLAHCDHCRAYERELVHLGQAFEKLRGTPTPLTDLWPRIELRARRRARTPLLARAAAALVGFLGVAGAMRRMEAPEPEAASGRHLIERLLAASGHVAPFTSLPEYRLLRALPTDSEGDSR